MHLDVVDFKEKEGRGEGKGKPEGEGEKGMKVMLELKRFV